MRQLLHTLTPAAIVIGFVVMFAWIVVIAWSIYTVIGEVRFNRALKRRAERDFDNLRSSWLLETREQDIHPDGPDRFDTIDLGNINFQFHPHEDDFATEETGAVFYIRERYRNEFAQDRPDRPEVHY